MPDATSTRTFRPALVAPLDDGFVVVDDVQPVAVFVDGSGRCSAPVTWRHLPPAAEWHWPPRSLQRDGSAVRVHDQPDGPAVRLDRTSAGLRVGEPSDTGGRVLARSRFAVARRAATTVDGRGVRYESSLRGFAWDASLTVDDDGAEPLTLPLGPGSVTCSAEASDGAVAACVRRGRKRPWDFRPAHDLVVVPAGRTTAVTIRGEGVDITALCWPRPPVDVRAVLAAYLPTVLADCRAARENGAEDVRFTVRELDHGPVVDIEFRRDGVPHVRTDEPLDELGRPGGLRSWSIFLDEDLTFGTPSPGADGVVRL